MGIVVCLTMLAGLLMFLPASLSVLKSSASDSGEKQQSSKSGLSRQFSVAVLLALIGIWNAFWYGTQHLQQFWGKAAVVSGVIMMLTAIILAVESGHQNSGRLATVYQLLKPTRTFLILGLLASFLLYAVTLVQLNLGYPIIQ